MNQQVNVFWHEDICPEVESPFLSRRLESFNQPVPRTITGKELVSSKAGESQFVGIAGSL